MINNLGLTLENMINNLGLILENIFKGTGSVSVITSDTQSYFVNARFKKPLSDQ